MTINVEEWYDGDGKLNLTIVWDEEDPFESRFNDWTAVDFLTAIKNACEQDVSLGGEVCPENSKRLHTSPKNKEDIS